MKRVFGRARSSNADCLIVLTPDKTLDSTRSSFILYSYPVAFKKLYSGQRDVKFVQ